MRKYDYSDKAEIISRAAGFAETALVVAAFIAALARVFAAAAVMAAAALAMWYFTKKYCTKINGAALAKWIKADADFADEFFKENPQLKKWYCPSCRSVMIGGKCTECGYKKENKGNRKSAE
ncbi:MAG: hypothetical protein LUD03_00785 [Firmicutes bacterium]|nr:hypothetical protein [Bacillota bacterium]